MSDATPPRGSPGAGEAELVTANVGDVGVLDVLVAEFYAEAGYAIDRARRASTRAALEQLTADPSLGRAWLIRAAGQCVGYLVVTLGFSIEYGGRDAFVDELYVRPGSRRRGLASAALRHAAAFCRDRGIRALHLEVERSNPRASKLYEREGFAGNDRGLLTLTIPAAEGGVG